MAGAEVAEVSDDTNHQERHNRAATSTSNGGRKPLTRERILNAALELVDEQGADALTMRRLAAKLDVDTMALYRHVSDKEDLLVGVIDTVQGAIELPDESLDWKSWVKEMALRRYLKISEHPNLIPIYVEYSTGSSSTMRIMNRGLDVLEHAGFDPRTAHQIWHLIAIYVLGGSMVGPHRTNYIARLSGDERFPVLDRYAPVFQSCDRREEFELGLDGLLGIFDSQPHEERAT